jgi:hypothetical protein
MWLANLRQKWFGTPAKRRSRGERTRLRTSKLRIEALEDRTMPAITATLVGPVWQGIGPVSISGGGVQGIANNTVAGAVEAITVSPVNAGTAYIGTANGGVWETTQLNQPNPNWVPLTDQQQSLSISSLQFDPLDPTGQTLYAGVDNTSNHHVGGQAVGALKTTNGGQTWAPLGDLAGKAVSTILPTRFTSTATPRGIVLAAVHGSKNSADDGVYESDDGGTTFSHSGFNNLPNGSASDLAADPADPATFYAALPGKGIYRGTPTVVGNAAVTLWTPVNNGIPDVVVKGSTWIRLAVSAVGTPNPFVYAAFIQKSPLTGDTTVVGLYRSNDQGANWTAVNLPGSTEAINNKTGLVGLNPGGQAVPNFSITVDPQDSSTLYLGGDRQPVIGSSAGNTAFTGRIFRLSVGSNDNGVQIVSNGAGNTAPHADSRALVFDAAGDLLEADDGGVYKLTNPRSTGTTAGPQGAWTSLNGDLDAIEAVSVAYDPVNDVVLAGTQDNGSLAQAGAGWNVVLGGDGNTQAVGVEGTQVYRYSMGNNFQTFFRQEFNSNGTAAAKPQRILLARGPDDIRQGNALTGLDQADRALQDYRTIPLVVNAVDPKRLALGFDGVYESFDRGDTIQMLKQPSGQPAPVSALAYGGMSKGKANADVLYVARGNQVFVREGSGSKFTRQVEIAGAGTIRDIALDPTDWHTAYAVDGSHVWVSLDAGATWTEITGGLAPAGLNAGLTSVQVVKLPDGGRPGLPAEDVLLVGGRGGVYRAVNPVGTPGQNPAANTGLAWTEFGPSLPNAPVSDIRYVPSLQVPGRQVGDVLVVSTLGRGVWKMSGAAALLRTDAVLTVTGDGSANNITIAPDPALPWKFDVSAGNAVIGSYDLDAVAQINVQGQGGDDTLTVNGEVAVPGGVTFDGGAGSNTLVVTGPAGDVVAKEQSDGKGGGSVVVTGADHELTVTYQNVAAVQKPGLGQPAPAAAVGGGLRGLTGFIKRAQAKLNASSLPLLRDIGSALGGDQQAQAFADDPDSGGNAAAADAGSDGAGLLDRLFEEGTGAFSLADIGTTVTDPEAIRQLLDGLDGTPGNVTLTQTATDTRYDIRVHKPLDGTANLDLSLFGGSFSVNGTIDVSADIDLHLIVGVDAHGFYIDTADNPDPEISVGNLQISGDVQASGFYGLLNVGLDDTTLAANVALGLTLHAPPTDALGDPSNGFIRPFDLTTGTLGLVTVGLTGAHAANPNVNDLTFNTTLDVDLAGLSASFPISVSWADVSNVVALPSLGGTGLGGLQDLLKQAEDALTQGLGAVGNFAQSLDSSAPLNTPIPILPPTDGHTGHGSIADYVAIGSALHDRLIAPVQDYVTQQLQNNQLPTLDGLEQALEDANGLADGTATFAGGINLEADGGQITIDFPLHLSRSIDVSLDLSSLGLDQGLDLGGLTFAVSGTTNVTLQAGFDMDMALGVDLTRVTSPRDAFSLQINQAPTVSAEILSADGATTFGMELDSTALGKLLGLDAQVNGTLPAVNGTPALLDASVDLQFSKDTITLGDLLDAGSSIGNLVTLNGTGNVGLSIPVTVSVGGQSPSFLPGSALTFTVGGPLLPDPQLKVTAPSVPDFKKVVDLGLLFGLIRDPSQLAAGLGTGLGYLQDALNNHLLEQNLPLVGSHLTDGAQFIDNFRTGLLAEIKQDTQNAGNNLLDTLQQDLFNLFGPSNLDILVNAGGRATLDSRPSDFVMLSYPPDGESVQFNLELGQHLSYTLPFDLGLPGVGLSLNASGAIQVGLDWDFQLGFGLSLRDGFYFVTPTDPKMHVFTLTPHISAPGLSAGGTLGFLQVQATDQGSGFDPTFTVDLAGKNGRLTLTDLSADKPNFSNVVQATGGGTAHVNLHLVTGFDTTAVSAALNALGISGLGNATLPQILADLHVDWTFHAASGQGLTNDTPTVEFDNVKLDLGSLFSGLIAPVVQDIRKVTEPIEPVISFLEGNVPVLSDLAQATGGSPVTFLQLLADAAKFKGYQDPTPFVNGLDFLNTVDLTGLGSSVTLDLGSFTLGDPRPGAGTPGIASSAPTTSDLETQANASAQVNNGSGGKVGFFTRIKSLLGTDGQGNALVSFPILEDPMNVFKLLTGGSVGNDVTLINLALPPLTNAGFDYTQDFPILDPIISVGLGGGFGLKTNLRFGYDTAGLSEYQTDPAHNPVDLLDGFFVNTTDAQGHPVPQFTFHGNLHATLNLGIDTPGASITAGATGGVDALAAFYLHDPNHDGKLRVRELVQDIEDGLAVAGSDPLAAVTHVFDMDVSLQAYLDLFVKAEVAGKSLIPGYSNGFTYEIARVPLYNYSTGTLDLPPAAEQYDPPTADFNVVGAATVPEGTTTTAVHFTNAQSDAPNPAFSYSYDYDDDGVFEIANAASSAAGVPEKYLDDGPGARVVHGRITDARTGLFTDYYTTITVQNVAPEATFVNDGPLTAPGQVVHVGFSNDRPSPINALPSTGTPGDTVDTDVGPEPVDANYTLDWVDYFTHGDGSPGQVVQRKSNTIARQTGRCDGTTPTDPSDENDTAVPGADRCQFAQLTLEPVTYAVYTTHFDLSDIPGDFSGTSIAVAFDVDQRTPNVQDAFQESSLPVEVSLNGNTVGGNSASLSSQFVNPPSLEIQKNATLVLPSDLLLRQDNTLTVSVPLVGVDQGVLGFGGRSYLFTDILTTKIQLTGTFINPSGHDASAADTAAGLTYLYDFNNDGNFTDPDEAAVPHDAPLATVPDAILHDGQPTHVIHGRIVDKDGGFRDYYTVISTQPQAPVIDAGGPYVIRAGDPLSLFGQANVSGTNVQYAWHLIVGNQDYPLAQVLNLSLNWSDLTALGITGALGTYQLKLSVRYTDVGGSPRSADSLTTLLVLNNPSIQGPDTVAEGAPYTLTLNHQDFTNDIVHNDIQSWNIAWGDGQTSTVVIDPDTGTASERHARAVAVQRPKRVPGPADKGGTLVTEPVLDANGSVVLNADGSVQYHTVFENRTTAAGSLMLDANGRVVYVTGFAPHYEDVVLGPATYPLTTQHSYAGDAGQYTISAQAADETSTYDAGTLPVTVTDVAPTDLYIGPTSPVINEGDTVDLSGSFTDPGAQEARTLTIDWGDGSRSAVNLDPGQTRFGDDPNAPIRHRYQDNPQGSPWYTIQATVTDPAGGAASALTSVRVNNVAPTPAVTGALAAHTEGSAVTLGSTVTDPGPADRAAGFQYQWGVTKDGQGYPLPTGTVTTGANFAFVSLDDGSYVVTLAVTDKDGGTTTVSQTVPVTEVAPAVSIIPSASVGPEGTPLSFTSTVADVTPVDPSVGFAYAWSVTKDGSAYVLPASGTLPPLTDQAAFTFTPDDNGTYVVTLTATDPDGATGTASRSVTVTNVPPTVSITGAPDSSPEGSPVALTAVATDPSAADTAAGFGYFWHVYHLASAGVHVLDATGSGADFSFTPRDNGTYYADVFATDKDGGASPATVTLNVVNVPPTVTLTGSPDVSPEGSPIALGSSVSDASPADTAAGFTYSWTVLKNGVGFAGGNTASPAFTPDDNGVYEVDLSATDKDGGTDTGSTVILVTNVAPTAGTGITPVVVVEGSTFTLTGSATDPSAADTAAGLNLAWVVTRDGAPYASGSGPALDLSTTDEGTYTVTASATDKDGGTSVDSRVILVTDPAVLAVGGFTVGAAEGSDSGLQTVATFTDPGGAEDVGDYAASIDWGDGGTSAGVICVSNGTFTVQGHHLYAEDGAYNVSVTLTHEATPTVTVTGNATVSDPAVRAAGGLTVAAVEGVASGTQPVATFTDPGGAEALGDYSATIDWGDGTTSAGPISRSGTTFTVSGGHTYAEEGNYPITTTIRHDAAPAATAVSQAVIADAVPVVGPINGQPTPLPGQADAFAASFTDSGVLDTHTATFDWGDAPAGQHDTSPATVTETNGSGSVRGSHGYAAPGTYTVTLTVADTDGPTSAPVTFTVTVNQSALLLSPNAAGALTASGNAALTIPGSLEVDSGSATAITASGNASITAARIDVVGGVQVTGHAGLYPAPTTKAPAVADPFAGLAVPSVSGTPQSVSLAGNATLTIGPGVYSQIKVSGNASLTLLPGVYVLAGGLAVTGNGSITGSGVMLYNAGSNYPNAGGNFGGITLSGNGTVNLTPPAAGQPYTGILIFQARDNTRALSLGGNGVLGTRGTIYAPAAAVVLSGNGTLHDTLVVSTLTVSGNGSSSLTDGTDSVSGAVGTLLAGDLAVYVDNAAGAFTDDELARIGDAVAGLDVVLAPYNVTVTLVGAADRASANVTIDAAATSACGGAADGVLGCCTDAGEITLVPGWDWYAGPDAAGIGAGQFDFQTIVTHELGHALGLGHSADPASVMHGTLAAGEAHRALQVADLDIPDADSGPDGLHAAQPADGVDLGPVVPQQRGAAAPVPGTSAGRPAHAVGHPRHHHHGRSHPAGGTGHRALAADAVDALFVTVVRRGWLRDGFFGTTH